MEYKQLICLMAAQIHAARIGGEHGVAIGDNKNAENHREISVREAKRLYVTFQALKEEESLL